MDPNAIVSLVSSFVGGFVLTWLRGFSWFGTSVTYVVALSGGVLCVFLIGTAHDAQGWIFGVMAYTLAVMGGVQLGGDTARMRSDAGLPTAILPKFNELSK